jgi:hypothetical protein
VLFAHSSHHHGQSSFLQEYTPSGPRAAWSLLCSSSKISAQPVAGLEDLACRHRHEVAVRGGAAGS